MLLNHCSSPGGSISNFQRMIETGHKDAFWSQQER